MLFGSSCTSRAFGKRRFSKQIVIVIITMMIMIMVIVIITGRVLQSALGFWRGSGRKPQLLVP